MDVIKNQDDVESFIAGYSFVLEKTKDIVIDDGKMLTSFSVESREFDSSVSLDEIKVWVNNNCAYEWGQNWKNENFAMKK